MRHCHRWCLFLASCLLMWGAESRSRLDAAEIGPTQGALVAVGGGGLDESILQKFLELAGGDEAEIVVIPTAGGAADYTEATGGTRMWRELGAKKVTLLHTYDRDEADTEEFVKPLTTATAVWFGGGRQWRLADSYLENRTHEALRDVLRRGGVIGGSSAGATIQGSYLARGDSQTNTIMMGDHEVGLGFLKNVAIDQHLLRRNRQFDMLEITHARPELLGIGIDENTAIVVKGDQFEVIGAGYVAIYDPEGRAIPEDERKRKPFYFLSPGDHFDLVERLPFRLAPANDKPALTQRNED